MFFKRNKDQVTAKGKHETDIHYLVKLEDGQYISKDYYNGTLSQGTDDWCFYTIYDLKTAKRIQKDYGGTIYEVVQDTCIKPYQETQIDSSDAIKQLKNDETPKSRVNAEMAVNVKLDTAELVKSINELKEALCGTTEQPKIHELTKHEQPTVFYANDGIDSYHTYIDDPESLELLKKPNTRLAIIEDDTNA